MKTSETQGQWAFLFLQDRCTGCGTCVLACKAWNHERRGDLSLHPLNRIGTVPPNLAEPDCPEGTMQENWRRVETFEEGTCPTDLRLSHLTVSCQHCSDPVCAAVCPVHRIWKEPHFGAVLVSEEIACLSCGRCLRACPWDAPQFWRPPGRKGLKPGEAPAPMTKCDLCYERISSGRKPACAAACPTRALIAGPEEALRKRFPDAVRAVPPEGGSGFFADKKKTIPGALPHLWIVPRY